jgi:MOSC domain
MTPHDLVDRVAELLHERPDDLRNAGVTNEINLQGWLGARNLRLVTADPREPEISPGFWIAEHHDGHCVVMFDESPYTASPPVDVSPNELRRALVLVALDPTRPCGSPPQQPTGATGVVEVLLTSAHAEDAMQTHTGVELHADRGIIGDRYFNGTGTFSASEKRGQQLTLIEAEVLDALGNDGLDLTPTDARRNIVTRGIDLNALVGHEFQIGTARCIGRRLCEPCSHLQRLTGAALLRAMVHRGGLRADILTSGVVHVGDTIGAREPRGPEPAGSPL